MLTIISIVDFSCRYKKFIPIFVVLIIHGLTMEKIKNLWFDNNRIFIRTDKGRMYSRPLEAYPELMEASVEDRNDYAIGEEGDDIRWETLDVDLHISSFFESTESNYHNDVAEMFARFPWLNVSEVARSLNINKSLLSRYIYGIAKPSQQRVEQIRSALHAFGKELISA